MPPAHRITGDTMQFTLTVDEARIAIVGLGYVGLRVVVEFGKQFDTVGFDISAARSRTGRSGVRKKQYRGL